jgi:hypothetical protein
MINIKTGEINVAGLQKINKTLTKNMKHVKWKEIPPVKGPDSQGLNVPVKQAKTIENSRKINGRYRQSST